MTTPALDHKSLARFWNKVDKNGPLWNGSRCWLWMAAHQPLGYGTFWDKRRFYCAHRISYIIAGRVIPNGLSLDHLCRNPRCVNPDHLEPVTHGENIRRGASAKMHCPKGHEYTPENTRTYKGRRFCRACAKIAADRTNARVRNSQEIRNKYNAARRIKRLRPVTLVKSGNESV
jgi:hypothetical protein